jgi:hypothetical protein
LIGEFPAPRKQIRVGPIVVVEQILNKRSCCHDFFDFVRWFEFVVQALGVSSRIELLKKFGRCSTDVGFDPAGFSGFMGLAARMFGTGQGNWVTMSFRAEGLNIALACIITPFSFVWSPKNHAAVCKS